MAPPFQYQPYQNPYAGTIAALIARQNDPQAQAAQQSGQAWGQAIQGIGQSVAAIPQQMRQAQAAEQESLIRTMQVAGLQRQMAGQQVLAAAIKRFSDPQTGQIDHQGVANAVSEAGFPDQGEAWLKMAASNAEALDKLHQSARSHAQQQLATVGDLAFKANSPQDFTAAVGLAAAYGLIPEDDAHKIASTAATGEWQDFKQKYQVFSPIYQDQQKKLQEPTKLGPGEQIVVPATGQVAASVPEKPVSVAPGASLVQPSTGEVTYTAPERKHYEAKSVLLDGKPSEVRFDPGSGQYLDASGADVSSRVKPIPSASVTVNQGQQTDAKDIADAIIRGEQPPDIKGLYRNAGPVRAELARQGYDFTTANLDWEATKKHLATLNGAQQTRLRQAIGTASESLGVIEDLAKQWDGGKFPLLNKANLALAKNGALGPQAQQIATNLEAQITDVVSELGNVYMGGNSPTDHALGLAQKNLSADWTRDQLLSAIQLARTNLQIRSNSITNAGPVLSGGGATPTAQPMPTLRYNPATGKLEPIK